MLCPLLYVCEQVSIGGMATILNTSGGPIYPGDLVEWTLAGTGTSQTDRAKASPRRIGIAVASVSSPKIIGRCLSFAKKGADCLPSLQTCSSTSHAQRRGPSRCTRRARTLAFPDHLRRCASWHVSTTFSCEQGRRWTYCALAASNAHSVPHSRRRVPTAVFAHAHRLKM